MVTRDGKRRIGITKNAFQKYRRILTNKKNSVKIIKIDVRREHYEGR